MNDQERITDLILTEKKMSANYDTFASECVNVQLRDEFLKLLNQGPYGLYMLTVDGETVDEGAQEWWKLTKGGEMVNSSADSTPIADGDHFELTFTVGYDGLG